MPLPDWNNNGERDSFDTFVDMQIMDAVNKSDEPNKADNRTKDEREITGISMCGKPLYDATKDSDGMIAFKGFLATAVIIAGIAIPVGVGMGGLGVFIGIFGGIGLAMAILKNT